MTGWEIRRPPSVDEELARWTVTGAPQLGSLRTEMRDAVFGQPAADPHDLAERLTIVATELAGNALRHGIPPTVVTLQRSDGNLLIDVQDNDQASQPAVDGQRPPGEGGLGLILAQRLAQDTGWYPTDSGKRVWATFSLA
jgi:anti-sigma regulatory factor (Ser/Thr protein kinase)